VDELVNGLIAKLAMSIDIHPERAKGGKIKLNIHRRRERSNVHLYSRKLGLGLENSDVK